MVEKNAKRRQRRRAGAVLPFMVVSLVAVFGFVAFGIDIGVVAVARAQAQNAADTAAMTGARTLDGSPSANLAGATARAIAAAEANTVLGRAVDAGEVTIQHGAYHYDDATETFVPQFPPVPPNTYNLTRATVTMTHNSSFARVLNINTLDVTATATAAHRPRDVTIIIDFSGSMNNESDIWNNESYLGSANNSPNNPDPVVPTFGAYSSSGANLVCTSSDSRVGKCNITMPVLGMPAMVDDFYKHSRGSSPIHAFSPSPNSWSETPDGDRYMNVNGGSTPAQTVQQITGATSSQITAKTDPPMPSYPGFKGYTQGPKYWGKTFFIWPPAPETANDWRRKFFLKTGGTHPNYGGPMDDNTKLWDSSGNWRNPSGNYIINYKAILAWIKTQHNPGYPVFPDQLRAGRILYYDHIPDDVPAAAYNHATLNHSIGWASQSQRFWKEYIDFVLGVWRSPANSVINPGSPSCSYGPDFTWGTIRISAPVTGYAAPPTTRMHPQDNPKRPRHRFWFGPMTMIQYISDSGLLPGTAHDISMFAAKLGISAAIEDIRNNHPNDMVSLILFNRPRFSGEAPERGRFSNAQVVLSRDYAALQEALWYPPNSSGADVRPWDEDGIQTPRSGADYQANTCSNYGFMLAYNQFSSSSTLRSQAVGGNGRKGAQRMVIFETDGMANVAANAGFVSNGKNSYYQLGDGAVTPGGAADTAVYSVVDRICALETDNTVGPGFARPGRPVIIHCIAFGAVFEPSASGTEAANALALLTNIAAKGNTEFPVDYKIVIGTLEERREKLRQAFRKITDTGTTPVLIE